MPVIEGKSGVNIRRLVHNIADQYSLVPQEATLVELIANSLDAKASNIEIEFDTNKSILEVTDNGTGMDKRQFIEYHDFAASTKQRGSGIGFAGQGAKLALNFCNNVITQTQSASYKGYSEWRLKGNDAPYKIFDRENKDLDHFGTRVTLHLDNKSKDFYTKESIISSLKEQYYPLLDKSLIKYYTGEQVLEQTLLFPVSTPIYEKGLKFSINGEVISEKPVQDLLKNQKDISIKILDREEIKGFFGITRNELDESLQGVAICVYGKVVERTWFKKEPREKQKITGWIEAPFLSEAITTDKSRFQKGNKTYENFFRKAQLEFNKWLEEIGLVEKQIEKKADFSSLEREINSILRNIPELTFFGTRTREQVAIPDKEGNARKLGEGTQKAPGTKGGTGEGEGIPVYPGDDQGQSPTLELGSETAAKTRQRTVRGGIQMMLDNRPDIQKEAWFDSETIFINEAHPAYKRSQKEGMYNYHLIKSAVFSLIEFKMEKDPEPSYKKVFELSEKFFKLWGTP